MKIYDLMYSKEALNIYMYLFSHNKLNNEKENITKNILYITYMYCLYYEKTKSIEKLYRLFQEIDYIENVDNLLNTDKNLQQFYQLFSMHEDILQEDKKKEYQLCLFELKQSLLNTKINDLLYFIKIYNRLNENYEKMFDKTCSQEELNIINDEIKKDLQYLENYLSTNDIESYKTYFKYKNNESFNSVVNIGMKLFEFQKGKITFSELNQLKELKTRTTKYLSFNQLENMQIEKDEWKQIKIYSIKKILIGILEFLIFYLLIGRLGIEAFKNFINTNNIYMLLPFIIWIVIIVLYLIYFLGYIIIILKHRNFCKGMIGFVADINWGHGQNRRRFYDIYFPKLNVHYRIRTTNATSKLKRKRMVKLVKIGTKKIVVHMNNNI